MYDMETMADSSLSGVVNLELPNLYRHPTDNGERARIKGVEAVPWIRQGSQILIDLRKANVKHVVLSDPATCDPPWDFPDSLL